MAYSITVPTTQKSEQVFSTPTIDVDMDAQYLNAIQNHSQIELATPDYSTLPEGYLKDPNPSIENMPNMDVTTNQALGANSSGNLPGHYSDFYEGKIPIADKQVTDIATSQVDDQQHSNTLDALKKLATPVKPSTETPKTPEQIRDPLGVRILKDVGQGISEWFPSISQGPQGINIDPGAVISGAWRGAALAGNSVDKLAIWLDNNIPGLETGTDAISNWINKTVDAHVMNTSEDLKAGKDVIPTPEMVGVADPKTYTGAMAKGAAEFTVGFIPTFRAIKALTWVGDAWKGINVVRAILAGASQGITFEPHEAQLFNLMEEHGPAFAQPIAHALAANPNDSEAWGRVKQAMSGMLGNTIAEGFINGLSMLKYVRMAKGVTEGVPPPKVTAQDFSPAVKVEGTSTPEGIQPNSKEFWQAEAAKNAQTIAKLEEIAPTGLTPKGADELKNAKDFVDVYDKKIEAARSSADIASDRATKYSRTYAASPENPTHQSIVENLPAEDKNALQPNGEEPAKASGTMGFVDKQGKFHTAEEMTTAVKQSADEQAAQITSSNTLKFSAKPGEGSVNPDVYNDFIAGKKGSGINKVLDTFSNTNMTQASHVYQVIDRIAAMVKTRTNPTGAAGTSTTAPITIEAKAALAKKFGMTPLELETRNPTLMEPGRFAATAKLIDASRNSVIKLAKGILADTKEAGSEGALYNFLRALNNHRGMINLLRTGDVVASNTNYFGKLPPLFGDVSSVVNKQAAALANEGGASKVRVLMRAIADSPDVATFEQAASNTVLSKIKSLDGIAQQWWFFNLLSGMGTQVNNIVGNTFNFAMQVPVRAIAAKLNLSGDTAGVQNGEASALTMGYMTSMGDAWKLAYKSFKENKPIDASTKMDEIVTNYLSSEKTGLTGPAGKAIDLMGVAASIPGRALMAADGFFQIAARGGQVAALALRQGLKARLEGPALKARIDYLRNNPTDIIGADAQQFGRQVTWTEPLGPRMQKVQDIIAKGGILGKLIVPFVRTNTNIFRDNVGYSPLAILKKSYWDDVNTGGARANIANAKMTMGYGAVALGTVLTLQDMMTGNGPADPALKQTWLETHRPNSFKVSGVPNKILEALGADTAPDGSRWVSYMPFATIGTTLSATASIAENYGMYPAQDWEHTAMHVALATSQSVLSQTWMRDFSGFVTFMNNPLSHDGQVWLEKQAGTIVVPAGAAQFAHAIDPVWRETNTMLDTIQSRIPFASTSLMPRLNRAGQPIYSQSLGPDVISPFYQYTPDGKPFFKWALDNQVNIGMPSPVQFGQEGVGGIRLTTEEQYQLNKLVGNDFKLINGKGWYDLMNDIMDGKDALSSSWNQLTDGPNGTKSDMAKGIDRAYKEAAINAMIDPSSQYYNHGLAMRLLLSQNQKIYNKTIGPGVAP